MAPWCAQIEASMSNPFSKFSSRPAAGIQMRQIVKKFKTVAGEVTVLKGIDVDFYPGEFVGVIGKSGSGKSTMVNMITGIDRPTSGEVQIGGTAVHKFNESQMSRWRGLNLGIVFQFYQLMPVLTLIENVMLPMDIANKVPAAQRETRALQLLQMVGLQEDAHKMPSAVSGGQQQAAAIARAMANDPPIIIADEPTGNLDSRTAEHIFEIFQELVEQGKTIIVVTHDPQLSQRTGRTVLLCDGEVVHPAIAAGLPMLTHPQMLALTKRSQALQFAPGERIVAPGQAVDALYLVAAGGVEIGGERRGRQYRLGPGGAFGQMALLSGQPALSAANASSDQPAEVLAVEGAALRELIAQSGKLRDGLLNSTEAHL